MYVDGTITKPRFFTDPINNLIKTLFHCNHLYVSHLHKKVILSIENVAQI